MDIREEFLNEKGYNHLNENRYIEYCTWLEQKLTETNQALQLHKTNVSGSDILEAINESMELIDYMHQLTVIPDNMVEDYANRFTNTMHLLSEVRHHYR